MPKKPETVFKEKVLKELRKLPNSFWEKIQQTAIRGTPDIIGCCNGQFVGIELKVDDEEPDPLQSYKLQQIFNAKGIALVMNPENFDQYYDILQKVSIGAVKLKVVHKQIKETMQ